MHRELDVAVVEADDHPERDHVVAHRVDERAAELAVALAAAQRPAHRVDHVVERLLRRCQTSFTPSAQTCGFSPCEPEAVERDAGQVALRALGENGDSGEHVGAGLEVRELLAAPAAALVAGLHPADAPVGDEQLRRRRLGQDRRARLLGLLGEPAPELRERRDVVAAVAHRRRRRDPHRAPGREEVAPTRARPARGTASSSARTRPSKSARSETGFTTAPESRCDPGCLPFSSTATGTSPSRSASSGASSSSCPRRIAHASPAGPAPTIRIPTSISGSPGAATNSRVEEGICRRSGFNRLGVGSA